MAGWRNLVDAQDVDQAVKILWWVIHRAGSSPAPATMIVEYVKNSLSIEQQMPDMFVGQYLTDDIVAWVKTELIKLGLIQETAKLTTVIWRSIGECGLIRPNEKITVFWNLRNT